MLGLKLNHVSKRGHWCQVISCLTKAIACHHTSNANQWHRLWGIPATIDVIGNITTFNNIYRFIVNMFYCGRIPFHEFEHIDTKGVRWPVKSAEATVPVVITMSVECDSLGLMASRFDYLFARTLVYCDNKPIQNRSYSLKHNTHTPHNTHTHANKHACTHGHMHSCTRTCIHTYRIVDA